MRDALPRLRHSHPQANSRIFVDVLFRRFREPRGELPVTERRRCFKEGQESMDLLCWQHINQFVKAFALAHKILFAATKTAVLLYIR